MSEDKKLIVLKTKQKEDSGVEDMLDDCIKIIDVEGKEFTHGVTILFNEDSIDFLGMCLLLILL